MSSDISLKNDIWQHAILPNSSTIQDAIINLDRLGIKIVMIVNDKNQLEGTISDGDIRRGLLKGVALNSSISAVIHKNPLVVPKEMYRDAVLQLMIVNKIHQIPVLDEQNCIVGLHLWDEFAEIPVRSNKMIIMAGGKGTRLRPYTETCPKPMVMVSGRPMLEHIIDRAKEEGISDFVLAVHYLGHMIEDYFGNGSRLGVSITYIREKEPLGTAGALGLLENLPGEPFLVTNGDVLTDIHYADILDFHIRHNAAATMAVRRHEWQHPYGVVHTNGIEIVGIEEKPVYNTYINAGVYSFNPESLHCLPKNISCDMPYFFERISSSNLSTIAYPMHEPWLDVGIPDDLILARKSFHKNNK